LRILSHRHWRISVCAGVTFTIHHQQFEDQMTEAIALTGEQMLDYRTRALASAASAHRGQTVPEIMHAAGAYLGFLLNGQPISVIGQTIRETSGQPAQDVGNQVDVNTGQPPKAPKPTKPKAAAAAATASAAATPAATASTQAAPATSAAPASTSIPAPATVQEAANSLKALVQDTAPGRGREAAVGLLAKYGVTQLSQIPAAKLAEFKRDADTLGKVDTASADPTGGLL
jgi:hypothetical protein